MDIRTLRYYIAVVEEGSISAAARKLHLTQPPLSAQMKGLEAELGTSLFLRGSRQIQLTPAGRRLYQYALEMVSIEEQAREDIESITDGGTGTLRIGCVSSCHVREVTEWFVRFHRAYPNVRFAISEHSTVELEEMLARGEIELAFVRTPENFDNVDRKTLRTDPMVLAGTKDAVFSLKDPVSISDLDGVPILFYRRWEKTLKEAFDRAKVSPDIICVADDLRTCLSLARGSLGLALVPGQGMNEADGLVMHPLQDPELQTSLELVIRKDRYISVSARNFFDLCRPEV